MCETGVIKYKCKDCGLSFWVKKEDDPRFCPFCESALIAAGEE